jgi:hypothetical protein
MRPLLSKGIPMLTILIAILALFAGVIPTYLYYSRKLKEADRTLVRETDFAHGEGFQKGWSDGFEYGRRTENLNRITGEPTYGEQ